MSSRASSRLVDGQHSRRVRRAVDGSVGRGPTLLASFSRLGYPPVSNAPSYGAFNRSAAHTPCRFPESSARAQAPRSGVRGRLILLLNCQFISLSRRLLLRLSLARSVASRNTRSTHTEHPQRAGPPNVNDPSAGSPTETLLRLLLPLNDQVWSSSRQHRQCRGTAAHQSEDLTKSFNR